MVIKSITLLLLVVSVANASIDPTTYKFVLEQSRKAAHDATNGITFSGGGGTNGINGTNGVNGVNGVNGINGTNGVNGTNGTNGTNGLNGTNTINWNFSSTNFTITLGTNVDLSWLAFTNNVNTFVAGYSFLTTANYNLAWGSISTNALSSFLASATYTTAFGTFNTNSFASPISVINSTNTASLMRTNSSGYGLTGIPYTALPWTPPTNTTLGITFALGYTPATNTYAAFTNVLGFKPATNATTMFTGIITNLWSSTISNRLYFTNGVLNKVTVP